MFKSVRVKNLEKKVEELSELLENSQKHNDELLESFKRSAHLIGIERQDRTNIFTFVRDGNTFDIQTFSAMSDNVNEWCDLAGLNDGG